MTESGWRQGRDGRWAWHDGDEPLAGFDVSDEATVVAAVLAGRWAPAPGRAVEPPAAFFLAVDGPRGITLLGADPHKKRKKWKMLRPFWRFAPDGLAGIEVDVAGRRISHGGAGGHLLGMATLGWSYFATTNATEQTWVQLELPDGQKLPFLTEDLPAKTMEAAVAPLTHIIAEKAKLRAAPPPPVAARPDDVSAQLARLAELRAQGVLDDQEFQSAKARVLSGD